MKKINVNATLNFFNRKISDLSLELRKVSDLSLELRKIKYQIRDLAKSQRELKCLMGEPFLVRRKYIELRADKNVKQKRD